MSYITIVNTIRAAAEEVNAGGRFINGRIVDASQAYDGAYPLIVNYPFIIEPSDIDDFVAGNIVMGFWQQDSPETSVEEREAIVNAMDILSDAFFAKLEESKRIIITRKRKEPQFQSLSATLSGFAINFTINVPSPC